MRTITINTLQAMKQDGEKFAVLAAYDATFAHFISEAEVEVILVGDSLGMVVQGHDTTIPVTVEQIAYHTAAVKRGARRSFIIADMPFMSYGDCGSALRNAATLMQAGAQMVKLEGGAGQVEIVEFLARHDIPLCAHLGLKPQSVHKTGGFRVQGREDAAAEQMRRDAKALQDAGADVVLLECIPSALGAEITRELHVPVIGIGAGPDTDGQILVLYDVLDITPGRKPRFVKNYMSGHDSPLEALKSYVAAVKSREYPAPEHCF